MMLDNIAVQNDKIVISELTPNEADFFNKKLQKKGIDSSYRYLQGSYYQYIIIHNSSTQLLNKVKQIMDILPEVK